MKKKRTRYTLLVQADQPGTRLIFEPLGNEYVLGERDSVRIEIRDLSPWGEGADVEIVHAPGEVLLFFSTTDYRAWNKAGEQLNV